MASIYEKQNEPEMQMLLCAQRKAYSRIKNSHFWYALISVVLASLATIWIAVSNDVRISCALTAFNVLLIFSREIIKDFFRKNQVHAAKIQQYFDASCYNAVLGQKLFNESSIFQKSEITEIKACVCKENLAPFANWYSDYRSSTPQEQILFSQKENIRWDQKIRLFYRNIILILLGFILIGLTFYCICYNATTETIFAIVSCMIIFLECAWESIARLKKDLSRLENIARKYVQAEGSISTNSQTCLEKLSELQNEIFIHRQECFIIPDYIYNLKKKSYQKLEDSIAEIQSQS